MLHHIIKKSRLLAAWPLALATDVADLASFGLWWASCMVAGIKSPRWARWRRRG
jgi:hypothetical protein